MEPPRAVWQQADCSVVRADVQRLSDSPSSFTVLDGGRGEVTDEHYSLSVVSVVNSGVLGSAGQNSLNISDFFLSGMNEDFELDFRYRNVTESSFSF